MIQQCLNLIQNSNANIGLTLKPNTSQWPNSPILILYIDPMKQRQVKSVGKTGSCAWITSWKYCCSKLNINLFYARTLALYQLWRRVVIVTVWSFILNGFWWNCGWCDATCCHANKLEDGWKESLQKGTNSVGTRFKLELVLDPYAWCRHC